MLVNDKFGNDIFELDLDFGEFQVDIYDFDNDFFDKFKLVLKKSVFVLVVQRLFLFF